MTIWFWISSSVSEIFAAELQSRPKSGQILHVFGPWNFFGVCPPKILDRHYKIGHSTDHHAKFHADRTTHLGDLALKKKTSRVKLKSALQAIASGQTKKKMSERNQTFENLKQKMRFWKKIVKKNTHEKLTSLWQLTSWLRKTLNVYADCSH